MTVDPEAPLIVRIAGLPASAVEPFSSPLCSEKIQIARELSADLRQTRSDLGDRLHAAVPAAPPALRRLFLQMRRDCHNGRPLKRVLERPEGPRLPEWVGRLAERVEELESRLAATREGLAETHAQEWERERRHLLRLLDLPEGGGPVRGIALASPDSAENLHRLRAVQDGRSGRKERRLEATLLRYVTRAAFKLSPYSTLTRLGLGELRGASSPGPPRLRSAGCEERSLLRLKRYLPEQLWDVLRHHPPVRGSLAVVLNDTIEPLEPGRYRFLRPGGWDLDPAEDRLQFTPPVVSKASLAGPVVSWLMSELPRRPILFGELQAILAERFERGAEIREALDRLAHAGVLCLLPPWPADADPLEARILEHLLTLPPDPGLTRVTDLLARLVDLETGFPAAPEPTRSVREMEALADALWSAAAPLAGLDPEAPRVRHRTGNLYEDVLLRRPPPEPAVLTVPAPRVRAVQRSLAPVVRFLGLYDRRHDFLLTLSAWLAERWPGRREMGVLELFSAIQPLWQDYTRFSRELRRSRDVGAAFNPLAVPEIDRLGRLRVEAWREAADCMERSAEGLRLHGAKLAALAERIPERYAPTVGPCLYLQPADRSGRLWVLNRLREGTGRWGSRFTQVMDPEARRAYTAHVTSRARDVHGDELLDVTWAQGDTLNVHAAQTERVLELPGLQSGLPADRRLCLAALRVRLRGDGLPPELVDDRGRPCRPVHLGGTGYDFVPTLIKILAQFGPGEMALTLPLPARRMEGDVAVGDRLTLDDVVVARRRWYVSPNPLTGPCDGMDDAEAFEAINRWRLDRGLPERVFFIEHVHHPRRDDFHKPQYLDFTSPMLVALFRSALRYNAASLTFEEMLPSPDTVPCDEHGTPWAIELLVDDLVSGPPGTSFPRCSASPIRQERRALSPSPAGLTDQETVYAQEEEGRSGRDRSDRDRAPV
jgi:hypothetical protein